MLGPKGKEQCHAVTLWSSRTTTSIAPKVPDAVTILADLTIDDDQVQNNESNPNSEAGLFRKDETSQDLNSQSMQPPVNNTQQAQDLTKQQSE